MKKEKKSLEFEKETQTGIAIQLDLIPHVLELKEKEKKDHANLTKDNVYYLQNRQIIKEKAKKKYREKMKNPLQRWEYLRKQRDYNNRRKKAKGKFYIRKLLYPHYPLEESDYVEIVFNRG